MPASAYIQEISFPSSGQIYRNVSEILSYLSLALSNMIFDRITSKINIEDSFPVTVFYKEAEISTGSNEYHVFQSEHYRNIIFRRAERMLQKEGYECRISFDISGRLRKIQYSARVVHPLRKAIRFLLPIIPIAVGYASFYLYHYINSEKQRHD